MNQQETVPYQFYNKRSTASLQEKVVACRKRISKYRNRVGKEAVTRSLINTHYTIIDVLNDRGMENRLEAFFNN